MSKIFFLGLIMFSFQGCLFTSLGYDKGYCEENGCDYSEAGVCNNPYYILQNKEKVKIEAYKNINCHCKKEQK